MILVLFTLLKIKAISLWFCNRFLAAAKICSQLATWAVKRHMGLVDRQNVANDNKEGRS